MGSTKGAGSSHAAPPSAIVPLAMAALEDDDLSLVRRCLEGEQAAWRALVRRYQRLVHAVARRAGLDDASVADVFQAVFERLHQHLPRLRQPERLQAWVVTTAKRESLALLRRSRRELSLESLHGPADGEGEEGPAWDPPADDPLPEALLSDLQQLHRLRLALDRLETRCRTLLQMVFEYEDAQMPYAEIAQRLGVPVGSLGPTRARCLQKLRRLCEQVR